MKLRVECYFGHRADERPVKFWLGDSVLFVESIEDQWYGPDDVYFRVRADDGNTYVLGHNEERDEWTLESFRSPASPGQYLSIAATNAGIILGTAAYMSAEHSAASTTLRQRQIIGLIR